MRSSKKDIRKPDIRKLKLAGAKPIWVLILLILLFLILTAKGIFGQEDEKKKIARNQPGQGESQESLEASVEGETYEVDVSVSERQYSEQEAKKQIEAAKEEIDKSFPGGNDSLEKVTKPVVMNSSYCKEQVKAEWMMEPTDILSDQGRFIEKNLPEEGSLVEVRARLFCGTVQEEYSFSIHVYSPEWTMEEELKMALEKAEQESSSEEEFSLPKKVGGKRVTWRKQPSYIGLKVIIFAVVMAVLLKFRKLEEVKTAKKERELELLMYYPQLVNTLSLLMGAGMSISRAWERMVKRYLAGKGGRKNAACEEMCITWNEIRDGIGERRAYERFGERCDLPQYKKLSSLLTQNLRKGTAGMTELLEKEAELALEQRKNLAKKLGEEAGTKLLLPMMMMLVVVMVIVIMPAILTF